MVNSPATQGFQSSIIMKIKKGHILEILTMPKGDGFGGEFAEWEIIDVFGDVFIFQDVNERITKYGAVKPLFMMRKSEILASPHFKVKNG